jgi:hypothetical protein
MRLVYDFLNCIVVDEIKKLFTRFILGLFRTRCLFLVEFGHLFCKDFLLLAGKLLLLFLILLFHTVFFREMLQGLLVLFETLFDPSINGLLLLFLLSLCLTKFFRLQLGLFLLAFLCFSGRGLHH